ncbi:MAG TPA: MarR family transcriptional regulator [Phenylobacterium sp.]|uniref:MarR family winged helix-turn-helix transcriptional regulator n=1 Tax=Phenylobacterium sp. TaxID=1871053 RepID=UPI002B47AC4F|nr:MarR family transcriptional regulator [Phenylobacterium sp.]HKR87368.1 MarR family transcriptional regulator [Phenylobacterium sp.]
MRRPRAGRAAAAAPTPVEIREKHDGALVGRMEVRVWLRLLSCSMIIEKRLRRGFIEKFDSTLPRFDVLATLERFPDGATMGELSRSLLVSNGNVTSLVRQLESAGFVATRPAPDDGRASIVALTASGRAHFAVLAQAHRAWIEAAFAGMPREELAALYQLLATLKTSIATDAEASGK